MSDWKRKNFDWQTDCIARLAEAWVGTDHWACMTDHLQQLQMDRVVRALRCCDPEQIEKTARSLRA